MRSEPPSLMPVFRSRHMAEIAAMVLLHPDQEYTSRDLARVLDLPVTTVHRETQRLLAAGVFSQRRVGRANLLRANTDNRAVRPLTELLTVTLGPHLVVGEVFSGIPGADLVLIFGSWARRYHGVPGSAPNDVDVLVVGDVERADVYDAADAAARRLGMPVNPSVASFARWVAASDPLVQEIKASPVVVVHGDTEEKGEFG